MVIFMPKIMPDLILDANRFSRIFKLPGRAGLVLVTMFLKNTPIKLAAMVAALKTGELKLVRDTAHVLIANAGTLGALQIQRLAERIQIAVEENRQAEVAPLVSELVAAYERARPLLEARRSVESRTP